MTTTEKTCAERIGDQLVGLVFDHPDAFKGYTAVVDPSDLGSHWRGDRFDHGLRKAIEARYAQIWAMPEGSHA